MDDAEDFEKTRQAFTLLGKELDNGGKGLEGGFHGEEGSTVVCPLARPPSSIVGEGLLSLVSGFLLSYSIPAHRLQSLRRGALLTFPER